jgi:hypothetical protein
MIKEIYGELAIPAVDRALSPAPNPEAKSRLEQLRSELPRPAP